MDAGMSPTTALGLGRGESTLRKYRPLAVLNPEVEVDRTYI